MKQWIMAGILAGALATPAAFAADTNVALDAKVITNGSGFDTWSARWGSGDFAPLASLTDGVFLDEGHEWNLGTVFWNGAAGNYITVELGAFATVDRLILQADHNDRYLIEYRDASSQWQSLATLGVTQSWGLHTIDESLSAPITADAFRISAAQGDGYFSVSEFQAFAPAVPEPATSALLLAGLGAVSAFAKRRKQRA